MWSEQSILDARAHRNNDKAVMQAYGFSIRDTTETGCIDEDVSGDGGIDEKRAIVRPQSAAR